MNTLQAISIIALLATSCAPSLQNALPKPASPRSPARSQATHDSESSRDAHLVTWGTRGALFDTLPVPLNGTLSCKSTSDRGVTTRISFEFYKDAKGWHITLVGNVNTVTLIPTSIWQSAGPVHAVEIGSMFTNLWSFHWISDQRDRKYRIAIAQKAYSTLSGTVDAWTIKYTCEGN